MRTFQRVACVAGAAAALSVAMTGSSWAGTDLRANSVGYYGSMVTFTALGEKVSIIDEDADGHSAVAIVEYTSGGSSKGWTLWNARGKTTQIIYDLEIPEGAPVIIQACVGEYGSKEVLYDTCGVPDSGTA